MRSHAFEVYLARPISRWDYFLGKLFVIMRPLLLIMVAPVLIVLGMAHGFLEGTFSNTWTLYPRALVAILAWATVNSIVILGISSMGKSARYASVIWFVVTVGTFIVGSILLEATQNSVFDLVSYNHCLFAVVINVIDLRPVIDLDLPILDIDRGLGPSLTVLGGLCALSTWLVMRRLRAGRLP
jgi:ABC-type transport system involved in multi-copper enzyme maturation permease subunit